MTTPTKPDRWKPTTHLRKHNREQPACNQLPGYYTETKLTEDRALVTCKRCLARIAKHMLKVAL